MNKIEAVVCQSKYAKAPHLMIAVDGIPWDIWLSSAVQNDDYLGLVPAISSLDNNDERSIAWKRIYPPATGKHIAPILICPDDLDFSCTVVVAEISRQPGVVIWHRSGLDRTQTNHANDIGTNVQWFPEVGLLQFTEQEYTNCLEQFKNF